jgi:hypothetical protein
VRKLREYGRAAADLSKILIIVSFLTVGSAAMVGYSISLILWAAQL